MVKIAQGFGFNKRTLNFGQQLVPNIAGTALESQYKHKAVEMMAPSRVTKGISKYFKNDTFARRNMQKVLGSGKLYKFSAWGGGVPAKLLGLGLGMAAGGLMATSGRIWDTIQMESPGTKLAGKGTGPGFITWSKRQGMPENHLGTRNLPEALHKSRHSSSF